jgi:hypothetical protein
MEAISSINLPQFQDVNAALTIVDEASNKAGKK